MWVIDACGCGCLRDVYNNETCNILLRFSKGLICPQSIAFSNSLITNWRFRDKQSV